MLYPNRLQAALLFERRPEELAAAVRTFLRIEEMRTGKRFHLADETPGRFYRLFEPSEELTVTLEYCDGPCDMRHFEAPLGSAYTGIVTPDIRQRIARTFGHVLIEASHGVLAGVEEVPAIAAMFDQIGRPRSGATQPQFERRLAVLGLFTQIVVDHDMPLALHWTQSGLLLAGELFEAIAKVGDVPGPLHVHPWLFGPRPAADEPARVGIRTFGARHWLGREVLVRPHVLPWAANFETILAFLRIATMPNGYVIPDGDTFGPEDRSLSYRVLHHDAGAEIGGGEGEGEGESEIADVPFYELVPLKHVAHGFVAEGHVPEANVIDPQAIPHALLPEDEGERAALAEEWAEKRQLAEGIGARFEVRHAEAPSQVPEPEPELAAPQPARILAPAPQTSLPGATPTVSGRSLRARVFGRKEP